MIEVMHQRELSFEERRVLPDGAPWLVFVGGFLQDRFWTEEEAQESASHFEAFFS